MSKSTGYEFHPEEFKIVEQHIDSHECDAMRLLFVSGWSRGEIKMAFNYSHEGGSNYHIRDDCSHANTYSVSEIQSHHDNGVLEDDGLDYLECSAARLLYRSGWTNHEMRIVLHVCESTTITKHIEGRCEHRRGLVSPMEVDWNDRL